VKEEEPEGTRFLRDLCSRMGMPVRVYKKAGTPSIKIKNGSATLRVPWTFGWGRPWKDWHFLRSLHILAGFILFGDNHSLRDSLKNSERVRFVSSVLLWEGWGLSAFTDDAREWYVMDLEEVRKALRSSGTQKDLKTVRQALRRRKMSFEYTPDHTRFYGMFGGNR